MKGGAQGAGVDLAKREAAEVLTSRGAAELLRVGLELVRAALYAETRPGNGPRGFTGPKYLLEAPWFKEEKLVRQALTWPAQEMERRGWEVAGAGFDELFMELLNKALRKVKLHGPALETIGNRAAYFMRVLKDDFRHNYDEYWKGVKRIAGAVEGARTDLVGRRQALPEGEATQKVMAAAHELTRRQGKPGPKAKGVTRGAAREIQEELFG